VAERIAACGIDRGFRKGPKPSDHAPLLLELACAILCSYRADVIDLHDGDRAAHADGDALGARQVLIPTDDLAPGTYQYTLRAFALGRPGTAVVRTSRPFTIEPRPAPAPPDDDGEDDDPPPPPPAPPPLLARKPLYPPLPDLPTLLATVPAVSGAASPRPAG